MYIKQEVGLSNIDHLGFEPAAHVPENNDDLEIEVLRDRLAAFGAIGVDFIKQYIGRAVVAAEKVEEAIETTALVPIADASGMIHMARGGNFKIVRMNLQNQGKANSKEKMPAEWRAIRRRKNKKKQ